MKTTNIIYGIILSILFLSPLATNSGNVELLPRWKETNKFSQQIDPNSPTGESEYQRYLTAYEAFWWFCVETKSNDLSARCEDICSGTPGASYGCSKGAQHSANDIQLLVGNIGPDKTIKHLKRMVCSEEHISKTKLYGGPLLPCKK